MKCDGLDEMGGGHEKNGDGKVRRNSVPRITGAGKGMAQGLQLTL